LASNAAAGRQEEGRQDQVENIVIIGGPNGAGKTTAAQVVLPQQLDIREFVNADEIARGLSPFNPEGAALAAGRLMIERIRNLVQDRRSFALETTNTAELPCSRMLARPARDLYLPLADLALIYDNSDEGRALIAERTPGDFLVIHDARRWALIKGAKP